MLIHNIIPQFCGKDFSEKVIFRSTFVDETQERDDGFGVQDVAHGEGFVLFDRVRDVDFVKYKDDIRNEIKNIFGNRGESMLSQCVVQTQKYYEHILRPQIDEIVAITNIQSEEKLRIKVDGDEISLNESDIVFLSEIKSDRIIFLNQSENQTFQIYTCKISKPKSLL
tara:strand:- start:481 stop:984 length:504 start_codon:yes stop_codon:yes gene_type:complete